MGSDSSRDNDSVEADYSRCHRGSDPISHNPWLKLLRNNRAAAIYRSLSTDHKLRAKIIVLTYVFEQLAAWRPSKGESTRPWRRVCAGIIECHFIFDRAEIRACQAFDQ